MEDNLQNNTKEKKRKRKESDRLIAGVYPLPSSYFLILSCPFFIFSLLPFLLHLVPLHQALVGGVYAGGFCSGFFHVFFMIRVAVRVVYL